MVDSSDRYRPPGKAGNAVSGHLLKRRNERPSIPEGVFKPKPSSSETKADMTTKTARSIISAEVAAREAKTERLRQARQARDGEGAPAIGAKLTSRPGKGGRKHVAPAKSPEK